MGRDTQVEELRSVDPATLEELGVVPVSPSEEVSEAVAEARVAADRWSQSSFAERRELLGAVAQEVLARADLLTATVTAETRKSEGVLCVFVREVRDMIEDLRGLLFRDAILFSDRCCELRLREGFSHS